MGDWVGGALEGCERKAEKGEMAREARKGGFEREDDSEAGGSGTGAAAPAGRVGSRLCILIYDKYYYACSHGVYRKGISCTTAHGVE